jgi:BirA family biotin operon repressor/biotin-[acetyl-CoA-carboxylase] ligase
MKTNDIETAYWLNGLTSSGIWHSIEDADNTFNAELLWASKGNHTLCYATRICTSTMDVARKLYLNGRFPENAWIISRSQLHGRGRMGRNWLSPGGNLYVTLRLADKCRKLKNLLPLAVACKISQILDTFGILAQVKWPNDILVNRSKVGGILIEAYGDALFAGIGLNIATSPSVYMPQKNFRIPAGCLVTHGYTAGVHRIWRKAEAAINSTHLSWLDNPQELLNNIASRLAYQNETVCIDESAIYNGNAVVQGITDSGELIIDTPAGKTTVTSGRIYPDNGWRLEKRVPADKSSTTRRIQTTHHQPKKLKIQPGPTTIFLPN